MKLTVALSLTAALTTVFAQTPASPATDILGRDNPRSSITGFLEAAHDDDYSKASQYLDLSDIATSTRTQRGPVLAKQLEAILNSDSHFSVLRLSRDPAGDRNDDPDQDRERIASVEQGATPVTLTMSRKTLAPSGPQVWLFSTDTVAAIPKLTRTATPSVIAQHLPPFFSTLLIAETPLWKWLALILAVLVLVTLSRQFDRLLIVITQAVAPRIHAEAYVPWFQAIIEPFRVILSLLAFRVAMELIGPSALSRLYIGRAAQALLVCSIAWCLIRLVDLFLERIETKLDARRRFASRSMLRLGRRTANATIVVFGILLVLSNWGYNTATLVAGLGVGGIAVALAAQQTIANVFGGVSIIGDRPIGVGEFGKFGDLIGTVEDIGMRSTRVRTLNRTVVSVPNSSFAGYNLENYSLRDKLLFNPTLALKRTSAEEQVRQVTESIARMLAANELVELVPTPVRLTSLVAASLNVEVFCYIRTADIDKFYTIQSDLLLAINRELLAANVELA